MPYRDEDEIEDIEEIRKRISEREKKQNDDLNKLQQELLNAARSFDNGGDFINSKSRKIRSDMERYHKIEEKDYNNITATDMKVGKLYHIEDPVSSFMENLVDLTMSFTLLRSNKITNLQYSQSLEKLDEEIAKCNKVMTKYMKSKIFKVSKNEKEYEEAKEFRRQAFNKKKEILDDLVKNNIRQVYDEKTRKLLDIYNNAGDTEKMLIILEIQKFLMKYDDIFYDHINKYTQKEKDAFRDYIDNGRFVETFSLYLGEQGKKDFRTPDDFKVQAYSFAIWDAYSNLLEKMENELPKNGMDYSYFQSYFNESLLGYISRDSLSAYQDDSVKAVYEYLEDSKDISIEFFDMYSNLRNELISASNNNINNTKKGISK